MFTSTRADLGPLGPVIGALAVDVRVEPVVLVTGTHLSDRHGGPAYRTELPDSVEVVVIDEPERDQDLAVALAAVTTGTAAAISTSALDLLVVLGDRWELLGACGAALLAGVPIAHLHGGEITEGAMDDRVRHAVTKLSDLHFCATARAVDRVVQMGEDPSRVLLTGAPGLDRLRLGEPGSLPALSAALGLELSRPFGLVTYHATTVDRDDVAGRARAVFDAAAARFSTAVVTAPGNDPGAEEVWGAIEVALAAHPGLFLVPTLGAAYPAALATADVMVGNSSSGIIEAASYGLPVVDVGDRQAGRETAPNVIHCGEGSAEIDAALGEALQPAFKAGLQGLRNPYGDGRAAARIVEVLATVELGALGRKRFFRDGDS